MCKVKIFFLIVFKLNRGVSIEDDYSGQMWESCSLKGFNTETQRNRKNDWGETFSAFIIDKYNFMSNSNSLNKVTI